MESHACNHVYTQPLGIDDVNRMVADVLHFAEAPESTLKLSELVFTKTKGNPFFTISFLTKLYQTELIVRISRYSRYSRSCVSELVLAWVDPVMREQWFDYTRGCWQWDLEKIEGMQYTDNVVEFMAQDLRKLPNEVLASCSPHTCDLV